MVAASILGASAPALADDSPPPVAGNDVITIEARGIELGGASMIDVLANDSAADGSVLEICRVQAPESGLSVAEVSPDGDYSIEIPNAGFSVSNSGASPDEGAREQLVVMSWANRAGTYQFTYWACDAEHLTPATVTVTVTESPEVTVRKVDRPGRLRFTNPRTQSVVVIYGGVDDRRPDGRVRLAPGTRTTQRVDRRAIRWVAFSPRTGETLAEGVVRGIRLPGSPRTSGGTQDRLTADMLRAWRS
jgi:hypothetical protein